MKMPQFSIASLLVLLAIACVALALHRSYQQRSLFTENRRTTFTNVDPLDDHPSLRSSRLDALQRLSYRNRDGPELASVNLYPDAGRTMLSVEWFGLKNHLNGIVVKLKSGETVKIVAPATWHSYTNLWHGIGIHTDTLGISDAAEIEGVVHFAGDEWVAPVWLEFPDDAG